MLRDEDLRAAVARLVESVEKVFAESDLPSEDQQSMLTKIRTAADNSIRNSELLAEEALDAVNAKDLRTIKRKLDQSAKAMRALLVDQFLAAFWLVRTLKAENRANRASRHFFDAERRITHYSVTELLAKNRITPGEPLQWSPEVLIAFNEVERQRLNQLREASYGTARTAANEYVRWVARHLSRLAMTYLVEIIIAIGFLSHLVGFGIDEIKGISVFWGLVVAICLDLLKRYVIDPWVEEKFLDKRKEDLVLSIRDFYFSMFRAKLSLVQGNVVKRLYWNRETRKAPSADL